MFVCLLGVRMDLFGLRIASEFVFGLGSESIAALASVRSRLELCRLRKAFEILAS